MFAVNSDAHSTEELKYVTFGIEAGWKREIRGTVQAHSYQVKKSKRRLSKF